MPIYEYACGACGHEFEEWRKMSDPPIRTCPKCKKKKVERLISQTAFQLKGGGWYADLYSSSKPGKSEGGEASKASDAGGDKSAGKDSPSAKSDTKSDSKSESKSEAKSDSKSKSESKSSDTSSKKDSKASGPKKSETRAA